MRSLIHNNETALPTNIGGCDLATTEPREWAGILVIASSNKRILDFFDTATGERLGTISDIIPEPHEMTPDEGRRVAYLSHTYRTGAYGQDVEKAHEISVIDVDGRTVADVIDISPFVAPHDVEYDPVRDILYAAVERNPTGQNGVIVIDPESRKVVDSIPVQARNCHWMAVGPGGTKAYVAHKESEFISVIDLERRTVINQIPLPRGAEEIDISPDGRFAFVASPTIDGTMSPDTTESSRLVKISTETDEVAGALDLEPINHAVRTAPDGRVLVTQMRAPGGAQHGTLKVLDPTGSQIIATVELGRWPFTIRVTPDSSTAFVANFGAGTVSMVDLATYTVIRTLVSTPDPVLGGTHPMCLLSARR
jgi:YVTN family beta-propeller protein